MKASKRAILCGDFVRGEKGDENGAGRRVFVGGGRNFFTLRSAGFPAERKGKILTEVPA